MRLALDHLTVGDAAPWRLVEVAADAGYSAACLFLHGMTVLPCLPAYSLLDDARALARTQQALERTGLAVDLVYPFTLTSRTRPEAFSWALQVAAELGAHGVNLLAYDRDPARCQDQLGAVADMASGLGLQTFLEFYPQSAIKGLGEAAAMVRAVGRTNLKINVDILHLYRSDSAIDDLPAAADCIGYAQIADGPVSFSGNRDREAASQRALPGEGQFDMAGFLAALPNGTRISVEAPDDDAILGGVSDIARARRAWKRASAVL